MKKKQTLIIGSVVFFFLLAMMIPPPVYGENAGAAPVIKPVKVEKKPNLDGKLDEAVWQTKPISGYFPTFSPIFGEKLPFKTDVWFAYDNKHLYFAFRCHDPEPGKIKTSITARDTIREDDRIGVSLDAVGSRQTSYHFYVNPNGIQMDALNSSISGEDLSPDFVWYSAGRLTETGYEVEIRVPLKSIGFSSGTKVKMGILYFRHISRTGQEGCCPEMKPGWTVFNAHAAAMLENLKSPLKLELLPSLTYVSNQDRFTDTDWAPTEKSTDFSLGAKYGISSSVTMEMTYNPDFSQVESDALQIEVNQRYPLFYTEKRPFFMEGADIFRFHTISYGYFPTAIHSRQIKDPLWGTKLTGSIKKFSFGVLGAGDEWPGQEWGTDPENPNLGKDAFFSIARGKYNIGKDNHVGFLLSGRSFGDDYNYVMGLDLTYRLMKHGRLNASFLNSTSKNPITGEDSINGSNFNATYLYYTKKIGYGWGHEYIGSDFQMDIAYLRRTGLNHGWLWLGPYFYPKKISWLKCISPGIIYHYLTDFETGLYDDDLHLGLQFYFKGGGYLETKTRLIRESWLGQTYDQTQYNFTGSVKVTKWLSLAAIVYCGDYINYYATPSYVGTGVNAIAEIILQPNKYLNQVFSAARYTLSLNGDYAFKQNLYYSKTTYQFNKYFFLRGILQYDTYQKRLLTDVLASFTLIPGTVVHVGYGGLSEKRRWMNDQWQYYEGPLVNIRRGFFLKLSYLWRL
jgi:hypothetical protein